MNDSSLEYLVPEGTGVADIAALARCRWDVAEDPPETRSSTYYDTFDWGFYLAGGMLEHRIAPPLPMLIWQDLQAARDPLHQTFPAKPAFAADLPSGPLSTLVAAIAGIRRLIAIMNLEVAIRTLRLCNEDAKTVVRVRIAASRFRDPTTDGGGVLPSRLRLVPVRGYGDERAAAWSFFDDAFGLVRAERPRLLDALAAAGRQPAHYCSKLDLRLDPLERADRVAKRILSGLLDILEANLPGARANSDAEFLHDLRVATRRSRSLLGQMPGVFPDEDAARLKAGLVWLQQATGPVRDLDVYLLDFDGYLSALPAPLRPHLEPLRGFLRSHYAEERQRLARALGSDRFANLVRDWRRLLEGPASDRSGPANAARPIKSMADTRIWRLVKRVRREGRAIRSESLAEELHELRKSCKKLRYCMELFRSLYPEQEIDRLIRVLKALLDNLGGHQDLAVQAARLRDLAQRMREEDRADTDTLLAIGALIGDLLARQDKARLAFREVFDGFLGHEHQRAFRELFAADSVAAPPA